MVFTYTFSYFLVTLTCSFIAVIILLQLETSMGTEYEVKAFRDFVGWYLGFVASNMVWVWINYGFLNIDGTFFSMINLLAVCIASYFWFKYVESRISSTFVKNRWFYFISLVPLSIALILIATTPFTKLVFYYNENNEYIHGPIYPTMFGLAISYLLFTTCHIIFKISQAKTKTQRKEYLFLAIFLVFPVIGGFIDIYIENLPVMELSLLFGIIFIYTNTLQSGVFNDALTGLNNRRAVDNYLNNQIQYCNIDEPLYFFMADINNFKNINDELGHIEGDNALKIIGKSLMRYGDNSHDFIARWGGDEFCIISKGKELNNPEDMLIKIQNIIDEEVKNAGVNYELKLAIGYSKCISPLASIERIINAADEMLYENKKKTKI